jgi:D-alanyl-D-alanine dipeptidase
MLIVCSFFGLNTKAQKNEMIELKSMIPDIQYDLKYATKNNFTGKRMYPSATNQTYLVKDAALALQKVAAALKSMNLGIWVWDAYRPYRATVKFWKLIHDERYVANPSKGSGHNRGIAIDMSIYQLSDGKLIEMPTGFDNFSDSAHHGFMQLAENKIQNRALLKSLMEKHGFRSFDSEWWHYSWPNDKNYEVLNLSFKQLEKY